MPLPELSHTYHRKNGIPKSVKQYEFFPMTKRALVVLWRVNFAGHERGKNFEDLHATSIIWRRGREGVKVLDHRTGRDRPADRIMRVRVPRSFECFVYLPAIQDPENRPVYIAVYWKCSNNMLKYSGTKTSTDVCKHINAFKLIAGHGPTEWSAQTPKSLRETSKAFWLVNSRSRCLELLQFHTYKICFSIYPTYINLSTSASR